MTELQPAHFRRHRFPAEIIAYAVWLYYRFPLSFRDIEDLLAERGMRFRSRPSRNGLQSLALNSPTNSVTAREATLLTNGSLMKWW